MASATMDGGLPGEIQALIKSRRALLWVCQRHDLVPGEDPHDYALPEAEAQVRYRASPEKIDCDLASFYWEAAWLEGARSPVLTAVREVMSRNAGPGARHLVVLASDADVTAKVNPEEFLELSVLPGQIGEGNLGRYGQPKARARERIAWGFAGRLMQHQGAVLIVIGARQDSDYARLWEFLDEAALLNLKVLVVIPDGYAEPTPPANPAVRLLTWRGSDEAFCAALKSSNAPSATVLAAEAIFVKGKYVRFTAAELSRVSRRWKIVLADEIGEPAHFSAIDFIDFLSGNLDNVRGFGAKAVVSRSYRSGKGSTLFDEAKGLIQALDNKQEWSTSYLLQIPAANGSGVTTMLRDVAVRLASEGVPTLILRPEATDIELQDLLSFVTVLWDRSLEAGVPINSVLLVIDKEHRSAFQARQILQSLVSEGRGVLAMQAVDAGDAPPSEIRTGRRIVLSALLAEVTPEEVTTCITTFNNLTARWPLGFNVPGQTSWEAYVQANAFIGNPERPTLFWVALRFFLTEGMDAVDAAETQRALGNWIQKRANRVQSGIMRSVIRFVALLSVYRIIAPLWTVLRPATGGSFSSELVPTLKELDGIVEWESGQSSLGDQVLRFPHPAVAEEYLRIDGISDQGSRLQALRPLQAALTTGREGDIFVSEALAFSAISPRTADRGSVDWESRLEAFEAFPPQVSMQSKTILHHWARCEYLSADERNIALSHEQRKARLAQSIQKLKKAIALPTVGRQTEHPSHLHNTAGTAYARYAALLQSEGPQSKAQADDAWRLACDEFNEAIRFSGHVNMDALLAFAHRLLDHAGVRTGQQVRAPSQMRDVVDALGLLDEASEHLEDHPNPEPSWQVDLTQEKSLALSALSQQLSDTYIEELKNEDPELSVVCQVRVALARDSSRRGVDAALGMFTEADAQGVPLTHRSIVLWIALLRRDEEYVFDFATLRDLHVRLERDTLYTVRPIDQFRHAVLCYQLGQYTEGAQRFRTLRNQSRREGFSMPRVRDVWRDLRNPRRARISSIRITRVLSDFRAEGFVNELSQVVPLRPRHFDPPPSQNDIVPCGIRFEANGPLAVPERFVMVRDRVR